MPVELAQAAQTAARAVQSAFRTIPTGTVISAGKMQRTVKVRTVKQVWNRHLRKHFREPMIVFAHDGNDSVREGDVVSLAPYQQSKNIQYTVSNILSPFGAPLDERPPLLTLNQLREATAEKQEARHQRRAERRQLAQGIEAGELASPVLQDAAGNGQVKVKGIARHQDGKRNSDEAPSIEEHGRQVLPGGKHKFGKINEEAMMGKQKALDYQEKALHNEVERKRVEEESPDRLARKKLFGDEPQR